jgi:hypothetical protein
MLLAVFYFFYILLCLPFVLAVGVLVGLFDDGRWKYSCPVLAISLTVYVFTKSVFWSLFTLVGLPLVLFYLFIVLIFYCIRHRPQ